MSGYRCGACGNRTRFEVVATTTTRSYHHYSLGGELTVEQTDVLARGDESVSCRWCGNGEHVVTVGADEPTDELAVETADGVTERLTPEQAAAVVRTATAIPAGRAPRRGVRTVLAGRETAGGAIELVLPAASLVLVLSTTCDGCADLAGLVRDGMDELFVLGVLRAPRGGLPDEGVDAFVGGGGRWLVGDDPFAALDVSGGPYFCLLDRDEVVVEGVAFGRSHVEAHVERARRGDPRPDVVRLTPP